MENHHEETTASCTPTAKPGGSLIDAIFSLDV